MEKETTRTLTRAGVIAGLYIILTLSLNRIAFGVPLGPVYFQFRPGEALTVLPILFPEAVPALFMGVLISNLISQFGVLDIVFGSLLTLAAAYVTRKTRKHLLAWFSPVIFNALGVSIYVAYIITNQWLTPAYWLTYFQLVLSIGISEALVVFGLGLPLVAYLRKNMFGEY
jgi:uncharacterized membrane protein